MTTGSQEREGNEFCKPNQCSLAGQYLTDYVLGLGLS